MREAAIGHAASQGSDKETSLSSGKMGKDIADTPAPGFLIKLLTST
jgi:hypothetical protein